MITSSKIQYIQGLRALSVLLVLLYHIDHNWLPSGYLGVDAFFAISGFVITRMILAQTERGRFSLLSFYISRVQKLLPPLFIVLALVVLVFSVVYSGGDRNDLWLSAAAAGFSVSNIFFFIDAGYFSEASIYKPLLHTWSLGVEEQFYLIWPLLLLALLKLKRPALLVLLISVALVSTFLSAAMTTRYPDMVFYLAPFRAYQFFFGIVGAFLVSRSNNNTLSMVRSLTLLGVPVVIVGLAVIEYQSSLQQFVAQMSSSLLIAIACGVSSTLALGSRNSVGPLTRIYSIFSESKLALYLGDRSYHIYLVHWPLITMAVYLLSDIYDSVLWIKLALLFWCFVLAEILYRLDAGFRSFDRRVILLLGVLVLVSSTAPGLWTLGGTAAREDSGVRLSLPDQLKAELRDELSKLACNIELSPNNIDSAIAKLRECLAFREDTILVVGDSYSRAISIGINQSLPRANVVRLFVSGCPPYFGSKKEDLSRFMRVKRCARFERLPWNVVLPELQRLNPRVSLIVAGNWYARAHTLVSLESSLTHLAKEHRNTIVIGVRPQFSKNVVRLYESGVVNGDNFSLTPYLYTPEHLPALLELDQYISEVISNHVGAYHVSVASDLCGLVCRAQTAGDVMYIDSAHLSVAGVQFLLRQPSFKALVERLKSR